MLVSNRDQITGKLIYIYQLQTANFFNPSTFCELQGKTTLCARHIIYLSFKLLV